MKVELIARFLYYMHNCSVLFHVLSVSAARKKNPTAVITVLCSTLFTTKTNQIDYTRIDNCLPHFPLGFQSQHKILGSTEASQ